MAPPFITSCDKPLLILPPIPSLTSIRVTCDYSQVPRNVYFPCSATGYYSDGDSRAVTASAKWSSSDTSVLSVVPSVTTLVVGNAAGSATVTASIGKLKGSFQVSVTAATPVTVAVAPQSQVYAAGVSQKYTAICVFSDNSYFDVTDSSSWSSSNTTVATVTTGGAGSGLLSTHTDGSSVVTANFNGVQGTAQVSVLTKALLAIQVTPQSASVIQGLARSYSAVGIYTDLSSVDLTSSVVWSVGDGSIASISNGGSNSGRLSALATGSTTVMATYGQFTDSTSVTVINPTLNSITVTPANPSVAKGLTQQMTATGHYSDGSTADLTTYATWSTLDTSIMTVSNAAGQTGKVTAVALGSTTISATYSGVTGQTTGTTTAAVLTSIAVTPSNPSIPLGTTQALTATGTYSDSTTADLTTSVTWASTDTSKATVSNAGGSQGRVTTVAQGSSTITASLSGITGQTTATVTPPTLVSIAVTPAASSVAKGLTVQYVATGTYTDASTQDISSTVTWASDTTSVATISNTAGTKGLATGAGMGSANISATLSGVTGQTGLTVTAAVLVSIAVTPANSTIQPLQNVQFTATGTYTDGSTQNLTTSVTWASSNTGTATISNAGGSQGRATGVTSLGTTTISATAAGGIVGQTQLTGVL